jgi:hypothetical protein
MTEIPLQLAHEWGDSLRRASANAIGDAKEALVLTRGVTSFLGLLSKIWDVITVRSQRGGAPANRLLVECDLLLKLAAAPDDALRRIAQFCETVTASPDIPSIHRDVEEARQQLDSLVRATQQVRDWAATPPRVAPDLEELKRRTTHADERGEWVPLKEAIARMRQGAPPKKE